MGADESPYDDPNLKGWRRYYNSQTQRGRANVSKIWLGFYASLYLGSKLKKRFQGSAAAPGEPPKPEEPQKPFDPFDPKTFPKNVPEIKKEDLPPELKLPPEDPNAPEDPSQDEEMPWESVPWVGPPPCDGEDEGEERGEGAC